MILSFKDKETEQIFLRRDSRRLPQDVHRAALRRLVYLHSAKNLQDLKMPPSNHLEALIREWEGQFSIRIDKQWLICFEWDGKHAFNVEIVDYH